MRVSGQATIRVGTSGWSYDHWQGAFYTPEVRPAERLAFYATRFPTVEINATFYRLPAERTVRTWYDTVPADFAFAVKGSRFITHYRRLEDVRESVAAFCDRVGLLGDKLRVILWQLPPDMHCDPERLGSFLRVLPEGWKHAVEFRDRSWLVDEVFELLSASGAAHVQVSSDVMPVDLTTTADFVYLRFHGLAGYHGAYVARALEPWAAFLRAQREAGRDAYAYFNNDANAHAPHDAATLTRLCEEAPGRRTCDRRLVAMTGWLLRPPGGDVTAGDVSGRGGYGRRRTGETEARGGRVSQPPAPTPRIVVVGGANTDVIGFAERVLQPRDSNPGHVRVSSGGVGRNIAENLARLGARVELVTAFGGDHNAAQTADECVAGGVAIGNSLTLADLPGSLYLAIVDESGDMALALSDMRPLERLTPDVLEERAGVFGSADLVVADANLPARSLEWLAARVSRTLVVDPVSVAKAPRVTPILARLAAVTPNALEAGILLGHEVRNRDQAESAAQELVDLGVQVAFVTCGSFGVAWADARSSGRIVAPEVAHVVNATGAGDAFTAGISFGLARGWSAPDAARFASGLAALALESERTVSDSVDLESVEARMPAPEDTSSIGGGEG